MKYPIEPIRVLAASHGVWTKFECDWWVTEFNLLGSSSGWLLIPRPFGHSRKLGASEEMFPEMHRRLSVELSKLCKLSSQSMLSPACLACGRALTDPVSMARLIGPECAHDGTLD
jgi:hypothetical protein